MPFGECRAEHDGERRAAAHEPRPTKMHEVSVQASHSMAGRLHVPVGVACGSPAGEHEYVPMAPHCMKASNVSRHSVLTFRR